MQNHNNIIVFLLAVLPVFLYITFVYFIVPKNFIKVHRAKMYLLNGMLSPFIVISLNFIFPNFFLPISTNNSLVFFSYMAFIQVALVEEISKFGMFTWTSKHRKNSNDDLPIATLFYFMVTSGAFALVENIKYLFDYGNQILFIRAITAIVLHMVVGVIIGYFSAKAQLTREVLIEKTYFFSMSKGKIKKYSLYLTGILSATIIHGIYDCNLFLPYNTYALSIMFIILFFGIYIGYFMITDLIKISKEIDLRHSFFAVEEPNNKRKKKFK